MEIRKIIIDTNAYSEFKRGNKDAFEVIRNAETIFMSPIVLGEILSGFILGKKSEQNRKELLEFLSSGRVQQITIDGETSQQFAEIFKELKKIGKPIPTNDIWIAASARQHNLAVLTYDSHFGYISGIKVVSSKPDLK